ncbi:MAG: dihydroneopterin aldolase [Vicinamibacterales bacterium]
MTGTTGIRQLQVDCIVGIYPHEREHEQAVLLDIEIDYDFASAAASDAIGDVVDYDAVVSGVTGLIRAGRFQLIETMAERAAELLLEQVPQATAVRIEIRKPAAVPRAQHSFVRVERIRS